jgi:hypothetical protein
MMENNAGLVRTRFERSAAIERLERVEERLVYIRLSIFIRGPRAALSSILQSALDLAEKSQARTEVKIGVEHVALQ